MHLMTLEEQVNQAQRGLQLTPEELKQQLQAIDQAYEDFVTDQFSYLED